MEYQGIVDVIKKTYGFYHQKYVVLTGKYTKTVSHYFTDKVVESHLKGYYALATFAGEKVTKFISVDIDEGGKKAVRQVMDAFEKLGIPRDRMYVSTSGKKGYHVDIFFNPWIYNEKAKNLYELMIWQTGLDPRKVEFRPTNRQAVKIPLGVHAKTRNRCWFLDRDTLEPIEDMNYIKEIIPIPNTVVPDILREWNKKRWNELYAEMVCDNTGHDESIQNDIEFNNDYYERHRITESGTRHNVMIEIACDLRHYGANYYQIRKALRGFFYRQNSAFIETSEEECLEDIDAIAKWAEESVPVWKYRRSPTEVERKSVRFDKEDINYILKAPSKAAQRVAFLLWSYCKMFGSSHISYGSLAKVTGYSVARVETAVSELVKSNFIYRKSGGCHYRNGMMVRESNTYFIPTNKIIDPPDDNDLICDSYEFADKIQEDTFSEIYYGMLGRMCKPEYLKRFLTKPELNECVRLAKGCEG